LRFGGPAIVRLPALEIGRYGTIEHRLQASDAACMWRQVIRLLRSHEARTESRGIRIQIISRLDGHRFHFHDFELLSDIEGSAEDVAP
jgi:hypothetical protein